MKKLACVALCAGTVLAVGCGTSDSGPPTILFDWAPASACPDLTAAGRESDVIINGVDAEGLSADEQLLFDCEDGGSGVIDIQDGDWDFELDVVDQYSDLGTMDSFDCFDTANQLDCLYYTTTSSLVDNVDTFFDYDPDVLVDFAYGYGNFTVSYTVDLGAFETGQEADDIDCDGFGDDGADDLRVMMTFYNGDGVVDDFFACGDQAVDTRDMPLGTYELEFDLVDVAGAPINADPTVAPPQVLDTHLDNIAFEIDISEV